MAEGLARASSDLSTRHAPPAGDVAKDKSRRGSSFLGRFGILGGRKKELGDIDSDSELGSEVRMDGANARVFSQSMAGPLTGGGYIPHHKEPPRYIRTRASNKRTREFNRMFLAQELVGTRPPSDVGGPTADAGQAPVVSVSVAGAGDRKAARSGGAIWATEFSKDGKYLATAGRDRVVRIWAVLSTPEQRGAHEEDEAANGGAGERLSAPVFRDQPVVEFQGHTGEVLDLSWSKNNFLLSSSMDKTVRLWHMSRPECLCTFKHKDFVTRLAFHPRDDRFFLAGSLDTMLRLWSIPDKAVAFSAQLPDLVTAVAFSPDGKVAIAGLLNGLCMFYETEGLKPSGQIHARSSRGKNAKGSKITGIQTMAIPPPAPAGLPSFRAPNTTSTSRTSTDRAGSGEVRVLITSNDSRIRIYNLRDKSLELKLKGHENTSSQIAATFSDDGRYVICGSEDRKTFIWSLTSRDALVQDKDKLPCEYFAAHGEMVTTAVFAPTTTRMLLGQSGDPIYDLSNPPPVVLQSLEEAASAAASQVGLSANDARKPAVPEPVLKRPEPSAAYIARSTHYDGNIIVTTGDTGIIKVFRQDCAYAKRRHESWETGSTLSRKLTAHHGGYSAGGLGRSISVLTRTSGGSTAQSRRGSLSQSIAPGILGSPQLGPVGGAHPDRILSWRQAIDNSSDKRSSRVANGTATPAHSDRSLSPARASRTSLHTAATLASDARKQQYFGSPITRYPTADAAAASPTTVSALGSPSSRAPARPPVRDKDRSQDRRTAKPDDPPHVPTPSFTLRPASEDNDNNNNNPPVPETTGGSSSFWNLSRWRGITGFKAGGVGGGAASSPAAATNARARSSGSRGSIPRSSFSLSRRRRQTDADDDDDDGSSGDEREVDRGTGAPDDRGRASRRQSGGGLPAAPAALSRAVAEGGASVPTVGGLRDSLMRRGSGSERSVPADGDGDGDGNGNGVVGSRKG
ncbi:WD40 repeat-like protein [Trichocladium antarcticum]|uniref:WD40 repeat-like protein n=1 Tax=Trichocladium antarcticum TaxID=1450529 RepID=A0AAN6UEJ6_9PEZI|nr:WD40 repeat-like protein [Trichocladium antarcticum]